MGFNTRGISQKTRFKRRPSSSSGLTKLPLGTDPKRMKWTDPSSFEFSPTAAPFNSTSFLIRQKSRERENEEAPRGALFNQYGSNEGNVVRSPTVHKRDDDGRHPSQALHPSMSNHDSHDHDSLLHLQFKRLRVAESGSYMDIDDSPTARGDPGIAAIKHRRVRSFTDDNFHCLFDPMYDVLDHELLERPEAGDYIY